MKINAITICVNYSDILSITLPRMLEHFNSVTIVTDLQDTDTWNLARNGVKILRTNAFYKNESKFNKGAAMDEALRQATGYTCIIDADIYLPSLMSFDFIDGCLHSPYRRIMEKPGLIPDEKDWKKLPEGWERRNKEFAGYFQLFHADDPKFKDGSPWYERSQWTTARGCDSEFFYRWRPNNLVRLEQFEVLHLGPMKINWEGRVSERWSV